ncbi:MAG: riboflavin biosynthesis protein RibF [Planctomycetes bacterium]|nr:riboflavin biosynthesis protein RibF [Planctomycetota bacterium]
MLISRPARLDAEFAVARGGIATLGVFDGVHLGHQLILRRVVEAARQRHAPAIVLTFAVHPVVVVKGLQPRLITSLEHRLALFAAIGVDACVVLPFDATVRAMSAEEFAQRVFVDALGLCGLVLGKDARIGRDRGGDGAFIASFCARNGITFETIDDFTVEGHRVSSTAIRAAISDGDLARAELLLGRPVAWFGTVVRGEGRGRQLGFATANLDLHHEIRPPAGVWAVRVRVGSIWVPAVLNIGIRPTFGPDGDLTVEAHLLDFSGDLYGQTLEVRFVARLREEMRFASRDALVEQIRRDVDAARRLLV